MDRAKGMNEGQLRLPAVEAGRADIAVVSPASYAAPLINPFSISAPRSSLARVITLARSVATA